jgi:N-acetylglucosamine-6-phosphate deacetylase
VTQAYLRQIRDTTTIMEGRIPARNVKADKRTGSIEVGKEADLLLVDGDPEKNIGDLRHVDQVMSDGYLMDGNALRTEAGYSGMPK